MSSRSPSRRRKTPEPRSWETVQVNDYETGHGWTIAIVLGLALAISLGLAAGSGCSNAAKTYPRHELVDQILRPRPGYEGRLTNRTCRTRTAAEIAAAQGALRAGRAIEELPPEQLRAHAALTDALMQIETDPGSPVCLIEEQDLRDQATRERLNALGFVCSVAGKRHKVCLDKPGLCRRTFKQRCFLGICGKRRLEAESYIDAVDNYRLLLDAGARCFNSDRYQFR